MFRITNLKRACFGLAAAVLCMVASNTAQANPTLYKNTMPETTWVISPVDQQNVALGTGVVVTFPDNPEVERQAGRLDRLSRGR